MIARTPFAQYNDNLVSVITPAYNSAQYIEQTLKSVQTQTYQQWELLVVIDKGTTDATPDIVSHWSQKEARIHLIKVPPEKGRGLALSRNFALSLAQGRFVAFLDSDDWWLPEKLEKQLTWMRNNQYVFTGTSYRRVSNQGLKTGRKIPVPFQINYTQLLKQNSIACLTVMLDRHHVGSISFLETKHEDFILWLQILKQGVTFYGLPDDLARYRILPQSRSANKWESVKNTWNIYRCTERLSFFESLWQMIHFALRNLAKYSRF